MKLYHGTNLTNYRAILEAGAIIPRGKTHKGNWTHSVSSSPAHVYLTDAYAPYFSFNACDPDDDSESCVVIETDSDLLPVYNMVPDEDVLEQAGRERDGIKGGMVKRTMYYRKRLSNWQDGESWKKSLQAMGTCGHLGPIPVSAITRVAIWPHQKNIQLALWFDPMISIQNYQFFAAKYRDLTAQLLKDKDAPKPTGDPLRDAFLLRLPPIEGFAIQTPNQGDLT